MSTTNNKYYFKQNSENVIITDFDYIYVLNEVRKVYDPKSPKTYSSDFILRTGNGLEKVTLDLDKIFLGNDRINVMTLIIEDIYYSDKSDNALVGLKAPAIFEEYYAQQGITPKEDIVEPEHIYKKPDRVVVDPSHIWFMDIFNFAGSNKNTLSILDWVVNTELNMQECSTTINSITDQNLSLNKKITTNSTTINNLVLEPLSSILKNAFVIKRNFISKFFGSNDIIFDDVGTENIVHELQSISSVLRTIIKFNRTGIVDASVLISNLKNSIDEFKNNLSYGISGIEFKMKNENTDDFQLSLYKERLQKINQTVTITSLTLDTESKKFISAMNKLGELDEILIPLLCTQLQAQVNKPISPETISIVRNLI